MNPLNTEFSKMFWGSDTPAEKIMKEKSPMNKVRNGKDYDCIAIPKSKKDTFHIPGGDIRFNK